MSDLFFVAPSNRLSFFSQDKGEDYSLPVFSNWVDDSDNQMIDHAGNNLVFAEIEVIKPAMITFKKPDLSISYYVE